MYKIAVDGPAGSGKSTIAKIVAKKLSITYLDTGAMYRMVTYYLIKNNIDIDNEEMVNDVLKHIDIKITDKFILNGEDVSTQIRETIINENISLVASYKNVREFLVEKQREIANNKSIIMDGRDIGTHVLKDAEFKFYLTASIDERARRRLIDYQNQGKNIDFEAVKKEIELRDYKDSNRALYPLKQAEDAILIDTTGKSIDDIVNTIIWRVNENIY